MAIVIPQITDAGLQAALAYSGTGVAVKITHIAAGDVSWNPDETAVALQNELERVEVAQGAIVGPHQIHLDAFLTGPLEYEIAEVGFFMEDGTLFAVWSDNSPYGVVQYEPSRYVSGSPTATLTITEDSWDVDLEYGAYIITCTDNSIPNSEQWEVKTPSDVILGTATTGVEFTSTHFDFTINVGTVAWQLGEQISVKTYPYKKEGYKTSDTRFHLSYDMVFEALPADSVTIDVSIIQTEYLDLQVACVQLATSQVSQDLREIQQNDRILALETYH
jgi:hypothetical protein